MLISCGYNNNALTKRLSGEKDYLLAEYRWELACHQIVA